MNDQSTVGDALRGRQLDCRVETLWSRKSISCHFFYLFTFLPLNNVQNYTLLSVYAKNISKNHPFLKKVPRKFAYSEKTVYFCTRIRQKQVGAKQKGSGFSASVPSKKDRDLAQLVAHTSGGREVAGSSPVIPTKVRGKSLKFQRLPFSFITILITISRFRRDHQLGGSTMFSTS